MRTGRVFAAQTGSNSLMKHAWKLMLASALVAAAPALQAAELALPSGAMLRFDAHDPAATYALPTGPWTAETGVPVEATSGSVTRQAFRLGGTGLSSYQIVLTLRQQLLDQGYDILFECEDDACGGFDFRYGTDVISEPDMHVDLRDYHFVSAARPGEAPDLVSLLVSRSPSAGYVQVVQVGAGEAPAIEVTTSTKAEPGSTLSSNQPPGEIGAAMESIGRFVLSDLVFTTGSSTLGPESFTSLSDLASYLRDNPGKRVALVGHTDAQGALANNVLLSKRRARSVMARLISEYGVPASQLEADGIGYLAPIASNQTDEGRARNRRVEAILISTK